MEYTVLVYRAEEGGFWAEVPFFLNLLQELKRDGKVIHAGTRRSGYWTLK